MMRRRLWLICDMDETLVRKADDVAASICLPLIYRWLKRSADHCMVLATSDDGRRPFQFAQAISEDVRPQFYLATSDGAALFHSTAAPHGQDQYAPVDGFPRLSLPQVAVQCARDVLAAYLESKPWESHSSYPAELYNAYRNFDVVRLYGDDWEHLVSIPGGILERQAWMWRNQAGPVAQWHRPGTARGTWFGYNEASLFTNLFVMGCPFASAVVAQFEGELAKSGLSVSAAPRTICIKPIAASKARAVQWLVGDECGASFGDQPYGNDASLRTLKQPFIAVKTPEDTQQLLEVLCDAADPQAVLEKWSAERATL
eukprot:GEMP01043175.1.p1 GENE.GEMP01043175.1~~GEMP01043175.1.p1  ORF type:complete len:315 (+),score=68.70 GEMP01043175.1:157-1101(+)